MKKTQVIVVCGKAQSGKDTTCEFLHNLLNEEQNMAKAKTYSFATPLKEFCHNVFGVPKNQLWGTNEEKDQSTNIIWDRLPFVTQTIDALFRKLRGTEDSASRQFLTSRELLQVFGTQICRAIVPDCWANATLNQIFNDFPTYAFIADCRFPNELEVFNLANKPNYLGCMKPDPIVIRLLRNPLNQTHESETAFDSYDFKSRCKYYIEIDNRNLSQEEKEATLLKQLTPILK